MDYSDDEVQRIRAVLSANITLPADPRVRCLDERLREIYSGENDEKYRAVLTHWGLDPRFPFVPLQQTDPELFSRIMDDELLWSVSYAAFIPGVYEWLQQDPRSVRAGSFRSDRGLVIILQTGEHRSIVKPIQSLHEPSAAQKAADAGIGPRQLPSIEGYLHEDYLFNKRINSAAKRGRDMGSMFSALHAQGVLYCNWSSGGKYRKGLFHTDTGPKIVDLGSAVDLDREFGVRETYNQWGIIRQGLWRKDTAAEVTAKLQADMAASATGSFREDAL